MIIRSIKQRIRKNGFVKSVLTLTSGAVIGQAINFFGMPAIGRIYTPAAIGDYTLVSVNAGVIGAIACLGMMTALMVPDNDDESRGLCRLITVAIVLLSTAAVSALLLLSNRFVLFTTEETSYQISLLVLWMFTVLNNVSGVCCAYANRHKKYKVMFWNPIVIAGINVGLGILFGIAGWGFLGYTGAHLISLAASILLFVVFINPYARINNPKYRNLFHLLAEYKEFPLYQMPANLIASFSNQIPAQLLSGFYSAAALGLYSMAMKILAIPSTLIAVPVNRVFYQEACERFNNGENVGDFAFKILKANIKIALVPICILIIFGKWVFAVILGDQWGEAGIYASALGLYQLLLFCSQCLSGDFIVIRKNHWNLIDAATTLVINIGLFCAFASLVDLPPIAYLSLLSFAMTLKTIFFQGAFLYMAGVSIKRYLSFVLAYIIAPFGLAYALSVTLLAFAP